MGGYVELHLRGDGRLVLGATDFAGVLTPNGLGSTEKAVPGQPLSVILKSGAQVDGVYGISAAKLILYMEGARMLAKRNARSPLYVVFIDEREDFELALSAELSQVGVDG